MSKLILLTVLALYTIATSTAYEQLTDDCQYVFNQRMLDLFNLHRAQHDAGALFVDNSLKKDAIISITNAKYAEKLIYPGLLSAIDLYSADDYPNSVPCEVIATDTYKNWAYNEEFVGVIVNKNSVSMCCGTITGIENTIRTVCVFDQEQKWQNEDKNGRMKFRPDLKQNISGTSFHAVGNRNYTVNATLTNL